MFNSLRSRLWLTYTLIILLAVGGVILALVLTLRESPLLYRQALNELEITTELWGRELESLMGQNFQDISQTFLQETTSNAVQAAIIARDGSFFISNTSDDEMLFQSIFKQLNLSSSAEGGTLLYKDAAGQDWFYRVRALGNNYFLLTLIEKPVFSFTTIIKDEFIGPIMRSALIVIIMAIFFSLAISNWITLPLKKISKSAEALSNGKLVEIPLEGPKEVRKLTDAFNLMSKNIAASYRSQREFIVNISHEFKTPLTSIQGFAQAIVDGTVKSQKEIDKAADVILMETNRLYRLVTDLLMLARLESGTVTMHQAEVSIPELLKNMKDKFLLQAQHQHIFLTLGKIPNVKVMADGDRLAQVFSNLIDNALKYTGNGGKINISANVDGGDVFISVKDSGIGISKEDQEKIFDRFYQVDSAKKYGKRKGFGLGLSIAREIIQSHSGKIWVESNPPEGSTFIVQLPIVINESHSS